MVSLQNIGFQIVDVMRHLTELCSFRLAPGQAPWMMSFEVSFLCLYPLLLVMHRLSSITLRTSLNARHTKRRHRRTIGLISDLSLLRGD